MLAYGGGPMRPHTTAKLKHPLVVDLAGTTLPDSFPLHADHDTRLDGIAGHGRAAVSDGKLYAEGTISRTSTAGSKILSLHGDGFRFQASVGMDFTAAEFIADGKTVHVNGRTLAGPLFVIRASTLKEISLVSIGADAEATVSIAASRGKGKAMPFHKNRGEGDPAAEDTLQAIEAAAEEPGRILRVEADGRIVRGEPERIERPTTPTEAAMLEAKRIAKVQALTAGYPDITAQAIADDWSIGRVQQRMELEKLKAERRPAPAGIYGSRAQQVKPQAIIEAALLRRVGLEEVAEKSLGEAALAASYGMEHTMDLVRLAMVSEGRECAGMSRQELAAAGFSTMSLPNALSNVAGKMLIEAYTEAPSTWQAFAAKRTANNFHEKKDIRPSTLGSLDQLAPDGEIRHATIDESTYTFSVATFAKMLRITRKDLINDDIGYFQQIAESFGRNARRKLNDLVYGTLLNAGSHFHTNNGNLLTGADSALSIDSLTAAVQAMMTQRDAEGNDLDLSPAVLVVPPELRELAMQIINSSEVRDGGATGIYGTGNVHHKALTLAVEPRLSNTDKFSEASATAWYLFGSPATVPMSVAFLDGKQEPTVEYFGLDSDPSTLGATWRVYHDFGSAMADPKAAVKSTGTA